MYDYYDRTLRKNIPKTPNLFRRYWEKHRGPYPNSSYFIRMFRVWSWWQDTIIPNFQQPVGSLKNRSAPQGGPPLPVITPVKPMYFRPFIGAVYVTPIYKDRFKVHLATIYIQLFSHSRVSRFPLPPCSKEARGTGIASWVLPPW